MDANLRSVSTPEILQRSDSRLEFTVKSSANEIFAHDLYTCGALTGHLFDQAARRDTQRNAVVGNMIDKPANVGIEALTLVANLILHDNTARSGRGHGIRLTITILLPSCPQTTGIMVTAGTSDVIAKNKIDGGGLLMLPASFSKITRNEIRDTGTVSGQAVQSTATDDSIIENILQNGVKVIDS